MSLCPFGAAFAVVVVRADFDTTTTAVVVARWTAASEFQLNTQK